MITKVVLHNIVINKMIVFFIAFSLIHTHFHGELMKTWFPYLDCFS